MCRRVRVVGGMRGVQVEVIEPNWLQLEDNLRSVRLSLSLTLTLSRAHTG